MFLVSCLVDFDDDDDSDSLSMATLKGTWTTVGVSNISSSRSEDSYFAYDFHIYLDDGYQYESGSQIGEVELEGSELCRYGSPILTIVSYNNRKLKVKHPNFGNAVLTMKKLGTLTDDDYRAKLCHGVWIHSIYGGQDMSYETMGDDQSVQQFANFYGSDFRIIQFRSDGTGECRRRGNAGYTFTWKLSDKTLTINTSTGAEKTTALSFIGIEGDVELRFAKSFNWN